MRDGKLAAAGALLIVMLATALFFSFPTRNTYLAIPGFFVAFLLSGAGHAGSGYFSDPILYTVMTLINLAFYWLLLLGAIKSWRRLIQK